MDCLLCAGHFFLSCSKNFGETGLQGWEWGERAKVIS